MNPKTGPKSELSLSAGPELVGHNSCSPDDFPPYERVPPAKVRVLDRLRAALAFGVILFILVLGSLQGVNAGEPDASPCASSEWQIGDQWGPDPEDVIGCIVESSGDPVPSFDPDVNQPAVFGLPATAPTVTTPPTDTLP